MLEFLHINVTFVLFFSSSASHCVHINFISSSLLSTRMFSFRLLCDDESTGWILHSHTEIKSLGTIWHRKISRGLPRVTAVKLWTVHSKWVEKVCYWCWLFYIRGMFDMILIIEKLISFFCYWKYCFHCCLCDSCRAYFMFIFNCFQRKGELFTLIHVLILECSRKQWTISNLLYSYLQNPSFFFPKFVLFLFPVIKCPLF